MTFMDTLQLGVQSFQHLGLEFLATMSGTGPTGLDSVVCGVAERAPSGALQAYFYLNPFGTEHSGMDPACAGTDWIVMILLGIIIHAISWWTRWLLWEPLANWRMKDSKSWSQSECHRFSQTATSLLFFTTSAYFAAKILLSKEWLFERYSWTVPGAFIDADYKFYHLMYASRFFSDVVSLFFEDRKKDAFIAAFIHHWVTIGLVLGSAWVGLIRYGGIIMFFFDWADIPLLFAKLCKYVSKDPSDTFQFVANRSFETFAVVFALTRNGYYNYVVYSAWMDLSYDFAVRGCQYLLLVLAVLQTYWLYLIIMAVIRQQANGGNAEDVREDEKKD